MIADGRSRCSADEVPMDGSPPTHTRDRPLRSRPIPWDRGLSLGIEAYLSGTALLGHLLHRLLQFFRTDVSDVSSDRPMVTEWIFELAITIAPDHVFEGHRDFCPGGHG